MDELVRWLDEQLAEDERIAQAAPLGPWSMDGAGSIVDADGERVVPSVGGTLNGRVSRWPEGPAAAQILGHDPARVLREIDAKRRILALHVKDKYYDGCVICDNGNNSCGCMSGWHWKYPCDTLKLLALPYADGAGYREEWRP
ncbi:DUF6221 family protein [Streptomyces sp. NPDC002573]|uniref:DUF6221 family protein n=1 Tax=Streptomyces sp. NPDC002573 TaxID=3364651 RepID=UPI00369AAEA5